MPAIAPGWDMKVDRGPGWIWAKVNRPDPDCSDSPPLADQLWSLLERHFTYRLLIELEDVNILNSFLLGQLILLQRRIRDRGGLMRLSGVSPFNQEVLRTHGLDGYLPVYSSFEDAVMGRIPRRAK
jgi:anti-anti-sigma factor